MNVIVLRELKPDQPDSFVLPASAPGSCPAGFQVSVQDLERPALSRFRQEDPSVWFAPPMPVSLVKPVSCEPLESVGTEKHATWGVAAVGADKTLYTGNSVVVAVLDTGIDRHHQAFSGLQITECDFTGEGNGDQHGHGTHCGGTIFGRPDAGLQGGIRYSVAPGVTRALIGKVLARDGTGTTDAVCRGVEWAINQGAHIVSLSLTMDFPGYAKWLQEAKGLPPSIAVARALEGYRANLRLFDKLSSLVRARGALGSGALIVAAAGNDSRRNEQADFTVAPAPPAAAEDILSVTAIQQGSDSFHYAIAPFANEGANLAAPGVDVLSALSGGGLTRMSGTSMAAPHVAGVAALWAEKLLKETGHLRMEHVAQRMTGTALLTAGLKLTDVGTGVVQAPR